MEHYEAAARDYLAAHEIDATAGCDLNIKKIQVRMEFTKTTFQRAVVSMLTRVR